MWKIGFELWKNFLELFEYPEKSQAIKLDFITLVVNISLSQIRNKRNYQSVIGK